MLGTLLLGVYCLAGFLQIEGALASTPFKQSLSQKQNHYLKDGVFIGGEAGTGTSLLSVRRAFSPKIEMERIVVDLGNHEAKPTGKKAGYYQVSLDSKLNRIVIDLTQFKLSLVSETRMREIFKSSAYIKSVDWILDPEDKAATLVLNLKKPMRLEVFELVNKSKPSRVVLDLKPMSM